MRKSFLAIAALTMFFSCKNENNTDQGDIVIDNIVETASENGEPVNTESGEYAQFGDKITADRAITSEQMYNKYKTLKAGDTINVTFKTKVKDVCQRKGCWMKLELADGEESFVKFKDYAFFVPMNSAGQEAIVNGKAYVSETSVAELKHYAEDEGKSKEEIAKITEPEFEYNFLADGVLISKTL
ncbi:DUF4920 domain-containing protein [Flavobacterium rhizosphaerae]|uniref:DUF4920 domain-containing protein n=1 Tax=Flavobacterium rhizosphaerae TaxID=3163298 RepID=A0ABW8YWL1_9FLAO